MTKTRVLNPANCTLDGKFEVEKIIDKRARGKRTEYYIKWRNFTEEHNSWEPEHHILADEMLAEFERSYVKQGQKKRGRPPAAAARPRPQATAKGNTQTVPTANKTLTKTKPRTMAIKTEPTDMNATARISDTPTRGPTKTVQTKLNLKPIKCEPGAVPYGQTQSQKKNGGKSVVPEATKPTAASKGSSTSSGGCNRETRPAANVCKPSTGASKQPQQSMMYAICQTCPNKSKISMNPESKHRHAVFHATKIRFKCKYCPTAVDKQQLLVDHVQSRHKLVIPLPPEPDMEQKKKSVREVYFKCFPDDTEMFEGEVQ